MANSLKNLVIFITRNAKAKIEELASKEYENQEKKRRLDAYITDIIVTNFDYYMPKIWWAKLCYKFTVEHFIMPHISDFTQLIYDLLKMKIEGVTK